MSKKFTNKFIESLKPKDKPYEVRDSELNGLLVRVQPNGRKYYYFEYVTQRANKEAGQKRERARFNLGQADAAMSPEQAREKVGREILGKRYAGEDPVEARQHERAPLKAQTFFEFLHETYRPWLQVNLKHGEYAHTTLKSAFAEFLALPLVDINAGAIESWRTQKLQEVNPRTGKPLSPNTINRQLSDLKACLHRARDTWDLQISEKLDKVKPCKIDSSPKVRYLLADEEKRLRAALDDREQDLRDGTIVYAMRRGAAFAYALPDQLKNRTFADHVKPMVLISLNTGLREGELLKLKWDSIDFERKVLTVVGSTSKTGKTRHVPLNDEALTILREWKKQPGNKSLSGYIFPSVDGSAMSGRGRSFERLLKRAKIAKFRWHDLRHTFASKLVMAGVDLNTVRELLGHSDYKMTLRYAHLAPEHKAAAVAKLCATL